MYSLMTYSKIYITQTFGGYSLAHGYRLLAY